MMQYSCLPNSDEQCREVLGGGGSIGSWNGPSQPLHREFSVTAPKCPQEHCASVPSGICQKGYFLSKPR
jgi:hypothetical protein